MNFIYRYIRDVDTIPMNSDNLKLHNCSRFKNLQIGFPKNVTACTTVCVLTAEHVHILSIHIPMCNNTSFRFPMIHKQRNVSW